MLRLKLLTVTSLAIIVPEVTHLGVGPAAAKQPASSETTSPDAPVEASQIEAVALDAARQHEVDPVIVLSVMDAESCFDSEAISPKGALGLMQVMPETARDMGYDPTDWQQNIEAGTAYLGMLMSRYRNRKNGVELALAAYNAGPNAVERYKGIPPFRETRRYVRRVMERYKASRHAARQRLQPEPALLTD